MNSEEQLSRMYTQLFKTWRSQVDSYWQRSNYFAAFETAALAGCWYVLDKRYLTTGIVFSILGVSLTIVWSISNLKTHAYVRHWWEAIISVEGQLRLSPNDFATKIEEQRKTLPYRNVIQVVPILFGIAWVTLFVLGLALSCKCPVR